MKVLRCKHWRYMKRRLQQFAKAHKKKYEEGGDGDLSGRLIWREGNRKHVFNDGEARWCEGVWCAR
jgi:hypothetical protein